MSRDNNNNNRKKMPMTNQQWLCILFLSMNVVIELKKQPNSLGFGRQQIVYGTFVLVTQYSRCVFSGLSCFTGSCMSTEFAHFSANKLTLPVNDLIIFEVMCTAHSSHSNQSKSYTRFLLYRNNKNENIHHTTHKCTVHFAAGDCAPWVGITNFRSSMKTIWLSCNSSTTATNNNTDKINIAEHVRRQIYDVFIGT